MADNKIAKKRKRNPPTEKQKAHYAKMKERWDDPILGPLMREKAAERFRKFNTTDRARASRSISSAANWRNPEIRHRMLSKMVSRKAEIFKTQPPTEFESRCYAFLDEMGIVYDRQHLIPEAYTIADAFIIDIKTCIYFDSQYWHSIQSNIERDIRTRLLLESLGYKVFVIRGDRWTRKINETDLQTIKDALCRVSA